MTETTNTAANLPSAGTSGKFVDAAVVFFLAEHSRYVSAFSPPCHPVPMINVEQSDRIPVAMSLRGDER